MSWSSQKKRAFLVLFVLSEWNFVTICVLSQCVVYWIHFWKIHTFTYEKTLLYTLLLLAFKTVKSLQFFLNYLYNVIPLCCIFALQRISLCLTAVKIARKFYFWKYKTFFNLGVGIFYLLKYKNFFNLRARKVHFLKYKKETGWHYSYTVQFFG